jgi:hydroxysqualene dehydroxylase
MAGLDDLAQELMDPSQKHVAVIGGGCAGLAAAAHLAERGIAVTLFEASPTLGGRARGIQYQNEKLDNGQHILLGAYSETLRLLRLTGVDEKSVLLRTPLQLSMLNASEGGSFELRAVTWLPAPFHILAGLLMASGLSFGERVAAVRFMLWMKLRGFNLPQDTPLQNLLACKGQPEHLTGLLWEPLCLAALNTPIESASAQIFLNVLRDSFSKGKADSDMLLPRQDFSALMAEPLAAYIRRKGGTIHSNTPVLGLHQAGNAQDTGFLVQTDAGQTRFSHVILAVSPFRLSAIIGGLPGFADTVRMLEAFRYQPIYTVYLQYPQSARLDFNMAGFDMGSHQGHSQWVFDRGALYGQHGLLAVVISAEGAHQKLTQEALALAVAGELAVYFPQLPKPLWHKVIAEKRATFACTANLERPAQSTPIQDLYLSGDYTAGDYPATIEGAVRSGVKCAELIISSQLNNK